MKQRLKKTHNSTLRIIGGKWRGRKITFADNSALRPTGDRIRETLFNWLGGLVDAPTCLDLYAGSGALSLEALSRGASQVTLIDRDEQTVRALQENFAGLVDRPDQYRIHQATARDWLATCEQGFDLIFLDPPFDSSELEEVCRIIHQRNIARHLIYIESRAEIEALPGGWTIYRRKQAGAVNYCLCQISQATHPAVEIP